MLIHVLSTVVLFFSFLSLQILFSSFSTVYFLCLCCCEMLVTAFVKKRKRLLKKEQKTNKQKNIYISKFGLWPLQICLKDLQSNNSYTLPKTKPTKNVLFLAVSYCHQQAPERHKMYCFSICWAVWGLTVQELTQICDITMKDEYICLFYRGGGQRERGEGEREIRIYLLKSNPIEKLN